MKKIIRFIFTLLLCLNLNVSSNKKDYSNYVTYDTVDVLNTYTYNNYLARCQNIVYQNGYYAPYYFKNLINNFPINSHGSCNYTAVAMLLSFYDTYWNDNIIPEQYEVKTNLNSSNHIHDKYSPGVTFEDDSLYYTSMEEYNDYIISSYTYDFQSLLIKSGRDFGVNTNSLNLGLDALEVEDLINSYMIGVRNIHTYNIVASYYNNDNPFNFSINYIRTGLPVLLRIGNGTNNHTVIAHDFNESNGEIYVHMGWKRNNTALTKVPLSYVMTTQNYTQIYDAIVLLPDNNHIHSNNFYVNSATYCPCQIMYSPNNIYVKSSTNYVDKVPTYSWNTTYKERWLSQNDFNYKINVKDSNNNILSTYYTETNSFEMTRPADFKDICEVYKNYKIEVIFNYLGNTTIYNNLANSMSFVAPTAFNQNPFLTPSTTSASTTSFEEPNYRSYNVNDNTFIVNHYRTMYNSNDDLTMMSCIDGGVNTSYMLFDFETDITRMDIELAVYDDSEGDLAKGSYTVSIRKCSETNQFTEVKKVVGDSDDALLEELPVGIDNLERITIYFDEPMDKFDLRIKYTGDSSTSSLGKIAVGDIYFYKHDGSDILPLSGYELEYNPTYWNETIVESNITGDIYIKHIANCYAYALNTHIDPKTLENFTYSIFGAKMNPGYYSSETLAIPYTKNNLEYCVQEDFKKYNAEHEENLIFIEVSKYEICPIGTYKVALVVDNYDLPELVESDDRDYHWYRQNSDGTWSHKRGNTEVNNLDALGQTIFAPDACYRKYSDKLNYDKFISYYAVSPWNGVTY